MYPILFDFGPIKIFTYGFFLALAFLTAIYVSGQEAKRLGLPGGRFYDLCFYIIVAAIVGSRLLYVVLEYRYFLANPAQIVALWKGGLVFHGGLAAALVVAFVYMRRFGLPWRTTFDALAVGMPLGQALGRVGCFMAGCCYGTPTTLPWAVTFTHPETLCPLRVPIHPAQLYEAFLLTLVFAGVFWLRTRKRFDGQIILTYFCLAGLVRFTVEFVRSPYDYRGPVWGGLPFTQLLALAIALVSAVLLLWGLLKGAKEGEIKG